MILLHLSPQFIVLLELGINYMPPGSNCTHISGGLEVWGWYATSFYSFVTGQDK